MIRTTAFEARHRQQRLDAKSLDSLFRRRIEEGAKCPPFVSAAIDNAINRGRSSQIRHGRILRLFRQAYEQGGVLSYADVRFLVHVGMDTITKVVHAEQAAAGRIVPCRGTIHDMGRSVTHKAIICYKRLVEKKPTSQVSQETFHSPEEVEYYVQTLRRVQLCHDSGMGPDEIAQATGHSKLLVKEYLDLIDEFHLPPIANPAGTDSVQTGPADMPNGR